MVPAGGDHQRPLGELLAAHVGEVHRVAVQPGVELIDVRRHQVPRAASRLRAPGPAKPCPAMGCPEL
jgi:hypothetical protein